jgi:NADPH-dependent ferric siderophore reductase
MTHRLVGSIAGQQAAAFALIGEHTSRLGIPLSGGDEEKRFSIWSSTAVFRRLDGDCAAVELESAERRLLLTLQSNLAEVFEDGGFTIEWDEVNEGALAPGLALMQVVSATRRSPGFTRVRLRGEEAARFATGSLHFRLLLPEDPAAPEWPRISRTGRTVWPERKIHKPVYTVVAQDEDWLDFDIFHHAGSPTCDWVATNPAGRTVGIMGPGGGWCPSGSPLFLFGDETAQPAIARMLALAEGEVSAVLSASAEDLGELTADPRVSRTEDLVAALTATIIPEGAYVWFAAGAESARAARSHLTGMGLPKSQFTAAAYWS